MSKRNYLKADSFTWDFFRLQEIFCQMCLTVYMRQQYYLQWLHRFTSVYSGSVLQWLECQQCQQCSLCVASEKTLRFFNLFNVIWLRSRLKPLNSLWHNINENHSPGKKKLLLKITNQLYKKHSETSVTTWILAIESWPPQMQKISQVPLFCSHHSLWVEMAEMHREASTLIAARRGHVMEALTSLNSEWR